MRGKIRVQAFLLSVLVVLTIGVNAAQERRTLRPVDEAVTHPDFLAFRTRLQDIVTRKDTAALLEVLHPDIRASFGSHSGIAAFIELWNLNDPKTELWKELGTVLTLGGTFDGPTEFTAPYTFSRWPAGFDAFEFVAVIGSNVRVRAEPREDAPVLSSVSYAILRTDQEEGRWSPTREGWTAIKLDGKRAYIFSQYVRSPIDYRARFSYGEGRWRMTLFIAGD